MGIEVGIGRAAKMAKEAVITIQRMGSYSYSREELERASLTPGEAEMVRAWSHESRVARRLGLGELGPCPIFIDRQVDLGPRDT